MSIGQNAMAQSPTACLTPTALNATSATNVSYLVWAAPNVTSFNIQYKKLSDTTWTTLSNIAQSPYQLPGLATCTEYTFKVQSNCSTTSNSPYSTTKNFKTAGCPTCNFPIILSSVPAANSANLKWKSTGAASYSVQYRANNVLTWTTINNITDTTYALAGLLNCKAYSWKVKANCSATLSSAYGAIGGFITTGCATYCSVPNVLTTNTANTAGVVVTWSGTGANTYDLQYKKNTDSLWTSVNALTSMTYTIPNLATCTEYFVRVKGNCNTNSSAYSSNRAFKTGGCPAPCAAPTPITTPIVVDTTTAILNWTSTNTLFNIQYKIAGSTFNWVSINNVTKPYTLTGLTACTYYEWKVQSVCTGAVSPFTNGLAFKTKGCVIPCNAPQQIAATTGDSTATIVWSQSTAIPVSTYTLQYKLKSSTTWTTVANVTYPYLLTGLAKCTEYDYKVGTNCTSGVVYSNTSTFATKGCQTSCSAPTQLAAITTDSTAVLSWLTGPLTVVYPYNIQYRILGTSSWTTITNVGTPYTLTGLTACKTYEFKVATVCSATSTSVYSAAKTFETKGCVVVLPCIQPTAATAIPDSTKSTLSWIGATGAYNIRYKVAGTFTWTTVNNVTANPYVLTGLALCTEYNWEVQKQCTGTTVSSFTQGNSFKTKGCVVVLPCIAPVALSASATTSTATFNWNTTVGSTYTLYYKLTNSPNATWIQVNNATSPKTVTNLEPCKIYEWKVSAVCTPGTAAVYSVSSAVTTACITPCVTPTLLVSVPDTTSAILSWTSPATAFNLQYRVVNAGSTTWTTVNNIANIYSVTGLSKCTYYEWKVQAVCDTSNLSAFSTGGAFKTTGCVVAVCNVPTNLTTVSTTASTAILSWTGTSATYTLQYRQVGATTWVTKTNATTPYTIAPLDACKNFQYQVQANCANGVVSNYSATGTFSTIGCTTTCTAPTALTATPTGTSGTAYILNWVGTATAYNLQYKTAGQTAFTVVNNIPAPYTVTGLAACKNVEWKVQAVCTGAVSAFTTSSFLTGACPAAPSTYCPMVGQNSTTAWIQLFGINNFSNPSGNNLGYGNFTAAPGMTTNLNVGATVSAYMQAGAVTVPPTTVVPQRWRIWVDYNRDGDFLDAGELAVDATNTTLTAFSKSIAVPTSATSGYTRLRVAMRNSTAAPDNCTSFDFGEVEDYTVLLLAPTPNSFSNGNVSQVEIYPNPGSDAFTLNLSSVKETKADLNINDLSGKCVYRSSNTLYEGNNTLNISDLNALPKGMYIISLRSNEGILMTQRWIKE